MISLTVAGLLVGFAVGVTGVGGGSLMTPLLILLFGFSPAVAVGTDLLYAAGTKSFGVWLHGKQKTVDWTIVARLAAGSVPASLLTTAVLHHIGISETVERWMMISLCLAIVATACLTLVKHRIQGAQQTSGFMQRWQVPITVAGGILLGVLVTLSSVGAGVLGTTFLLLLYPRLPAISVVGTDIAHAVPLTLIAGLGHMTLGTTDFSVLIYLLAGSLPGIWLGTRLGTRLPEAALRSTIAVLLLVIGGGMLMDTAAAAYTGR
ncbi:MAG: hypothetical protein CMN28_04725 [Salinisphaeraceae bacterium]|jgi:uncharacterized membrane protein YfcA|nr:hypothetical protein [Salinisphaeraceae bacterium]